LKPSAATIDEPITGPATRPATEPATDVAPEESRPPVAYFVTGTDTGVGKTLASAALLHALARVHPRVAGMKPVAAGLERVAGEWVNEDVLALRAASTVKLPAALDNPVALPDPLSPNLAAQRAGQRIKIPPLVACFQQISQLADAVVVEGAGGWFVPIDEQLTMADLAQALGLPVVLVVGLRLGCLNHALLTAQAIRASGLVLAGWVANRIDPAMACPDENLAYLRSHLGAPLLGDIPHQARPDARAVRLALPPEAATSPTASAPTP
jgi:dethiobiotin synthetase